MFLVSTLFCCAIFVSSVAHAEVIELEGTVKAVDVDDRTVSVAIETATGEKVLDLDVATSAGDLAHLNLSQKICFSYDPAVEVVTQIRKPMPVSYLLKVLKGLNKFDGKDTVAIPPGAAQDRGFVFGYFMGVGDALGGGLHMPIGQERRKAFEAKLQGFLEEHPDKADESAIDVIREVLGNAKP